MIFVTGGTGFLGSYIISELIEHGYSVRAIRRNRNVQPFYIPAHIWNKVEWMEGDILDVVCLEEGMQGADAVVHAAAMVSYLPKDRQALFKTNIEGTANVVNAALEAGIQKFVYISSIAALGRSGDAEFVNEEKKWDENAVQSNYAISKYHAEMEIWRGVAEGLNAVVLNPSLILGYGDWNKSSCTIFKTIYKEFPWFSNGAGGFVDVHDVAKAARLLMESGISNERFIISAENGSFKELFNKIADGFSRKHPAREATPFLAGLAWRMAKVKSVLTGKPPFLTKETAATGQKKISYDNSKILRYLPGFQFASVNSSIKEACACYLTNLQPV